MRRVAPFRCLVAVLAVFTLPAPLLAADGAVASHPTTSPAYILVGFAGGFVRHDNPHHGPVQLAQRIRTALPQDAAIQVFENRHRRAAYNTILRELDRNHDGILSD